MGSIIVRQNRSEQVLVFATNGGLNNGSLEWDLGRNMPAGVKGNGGIETLLFDIEILGINVIFETAPVATDCVLQIYENASSAIATINIPPGTLNYNETLSPSVTVSAGDFWWLRTLTASSAVNGIATISFRLIPV